MTTIIDEMIEYTDRVNMGMEKVSPGMEASFTSACVPGDTIWQGDLAIVIVEDVIPDNFIAVSKSKVKFNGQLVPGSNSGARHCIADLSSATIYIPKEWNEESLDGPFLRLKKDTTITHPVHGDVKIPSCFSVRLYYQREYDKEQERERRVRD